MSDLTTAATYDNPFVFRREVWRDGEMIAWYSYEELFRRTAQGESQLVPAHLIHMGACVGPWEPGKLWGDPQALDQATREKRQLPCQFCGYTREDHWKASRRQNNEHRFKAQEGDRGQRKARAVAALTGRPIKKHPLTAQCHGRIIWL